MFVMVDEFLINWFSFTPLQKQVLIHSHLSLQQVYPHGSTDTLPFATMGSGSLAAMSIFESGYKEDLTVGPQSSQTKLEHLFIRK